MSKKSKTSIRSLIRKGIFDIDITGFSYNPQIDTRNSVIASWENVGRYFHSGFNNFNSEIKK